VADRRLLAVRPVRGGRLPPRRRQPGRRAGTPGMPGPATAPQPPSAITTISGRSESGRLTVEPPTIRRIRRVKMRSVYYGVCDIGQVASEAIGWLDGPPPPSPVLLWLPLCGCGYLGEEQRPPVRATAWWPSLLLAAELGFWGLGSCLRGRLGGTVRNAFALRDSARSCRLWHLMGVFLAPAARKASG
jgi:hypothetical protein